jgi:hypothetical protein
MDFSTEYQWHNDETAPSLHIIKVPFLMHYKTFNIYNTSILVKFHTRSEILSDNQKSEQLTYYIKWSSAERMGQATVSGVSAH